MNKPLLRKVQARILAAPDKFNMNIFGLKSACGTTCCIGGWALLENGYKVVRATFTKGRRTLEGTNNIESAAAKALGLSAEEAGNLFFEANWPSELTSAFYRASSNRERALIAVARIERLLQSK